MKTKTSSYRPKLSHNCFCYQGESSECCGGLLVSLPREHAASFCKDMEKLDGYPSWIIGVVESGDRTARIIEKPRILEVPSKDREDDLW